MVYYTGTKLEQDVKFNNEYLVGKCGVFFFRVNYSYGRTQLQELWIKEDGKIICQRSVEDGSPAQCFHKMETSISYYEGKKPHTQEGSLTRAQALRALEFAGIDFDKNYYEQSLAHSDTLIVWAKATKYRKPKNANGSTGRYFFQHLQKLKNKLNKVAK